MIILTTQIALIDWQNTICIIVPATFSNFCNKKAKATAKVTLVATNKVV